MSYSGRIGENKDKAGLVQCGNEPHYPTNRPRNEGRRVESLIRDLQRTIGALEQLAEATPSDRLDEWLDQLFQLKIDLVHAALNSKTTTCQQTAQAVRQAANKVERALKQPISNTELDAAIQYAAAKLGQLLDSVAPID